MAVSRGMIEQEISVLNYILNRCSYENPVRGRQIRKDLNLSERDFKMVIESLRVNFGHPIVGLKSKPFGYYIPKNEDERQAGIAPYRRQILTEQKNLGAVMKIDLEEYWKS